MRTRRTHNNFQDLMKKSVTTESGCIEWTGFINAGGYGIIYRWPNYDFVHRVSARLILGESLPGQEVMHLCDNRKCFNPDHLRWGTRQENVTDMHNKGRANMRALKGEENPKARFTWEQVRGIRKMREEGHSYTVIAKQYGGSPATIAQITTYKTWIEVGN